MYGIRIAYMDILYIYLYYYITIIHYSIEYSILASCTVLDSSSTYNTEENPFRPRKSRPRQREPSRPAARESIINNKKGISAGAKERRRKDSALLPRSAMAVAPLLLHICLPLRCMDGNNRSSPPLLLLTTTDDDGSTKTKERSRRPYPMWLCVLYSS